MAVTMAQLSATRRNTLSSTGANMPWVQDQMAQLPGAHYYYGNLPYPTAPYGQAMEPQQQYGHQPYVQASHYHPYSQPRLSPIGLPAASPAMHYPPTPESMEPPSLPPRPPKRPPLEPDPLPPHSNPQSLTQSQSEAFTSSTPTQPVRIGKNDVWNASTGQALYTIVRDAAHLPSFPSTKPLLTVYKISTGATVGKIKFHLVTSHDIELTINGRQTTIARSRGLVHKRWGFQSTSCPNKAETWYWKRDKSTRGAMLEDAKKSASVLARMKGDMLTFDRGHLSEANCDEIVMSAIATAEAARRAGKSEDLVDLAQAVGDFAAASGCGGDGRDGGGGGGS